jgi:serine/threonine-protein kinase
MAQPFDAVSRTLSGEAQPIVNEPVLVINQALGTFGVSDTGTVLYLKGASQSGTLVTVERNGKTEPVPGASALGRASNPRLSPDGRRVAAVIDGDIWVYNFSGRPPIKLTFDGERYSPLWTKDGSRIVYEQGNSKSKTSLFSIAADGSGGPPEAAGPEGHFHPHGWTSDGQLVAVRVQDGRGDLVRFSPRADGKAEPVQETPASEGVSGSVSPDGKWVAYDATTTGRGEIWVRPLPGPGAPVRVSPNGGFEPLWSKNGRELYYLQGEKILSVSVTTSGSEFSFKAPVELFATPAPSGISQPPTYDVAADGRFIMFTPDEGKAPPMTVILNAFEPLRTSAVR